MEASSAGRVPRSRMSMRSPGRQAVVDERRRGGGVAVGAEHRQGAVEGVGPGPAARVVEGDGEVAGADRLEPPLDELPGDEEVGEADAGEVDGERGPQPRRGGEGRGDPGDDLQLGVGDAVPAELVERLEAEPGHPVDAGVAAAHHRDRAARPGSARRLGGALRLGADRPGLDRRPRGGARRPARSRARRRSPPRRPASAGGRAHRGIRGLRDPARRWRGGRSRSSHSLGAAAPDVDRLDTNGEGQRIVARRPRGGPRRERSPTPGRPGDGRRAAHRAE